MIEEIVKVLECMQKSDGSKLKHAEDYVRNVGLHFNIYKLNNLLVLN